MSLRKKTIKKKQNIRVVELFAGVGGFRLGLEGFNGKSASSGYKKDLDSPFEVVWSNQWEPSSKKEGLKQEANSVYQNRWPAANHYPNDIATVASPNLTDKQVDANIPNHDLLVGGFPCQDYSVAGVNTNGIQGKKGVLWWNIHKIVQAKRPKMIFLENVDRLIKSPTDQRGRDFAIMLRSLSDLGYSVEWRVINAAEYGMPQRRKRVYILAYHSSSSIRIENPEKWLEYSGVFSECFPLNKASELTHIQLIDNLGSLSKNFEHGKFLDAGVCIGSDVFMHSVEPRTEGIHPSDFAPHHLLKHVLIPEEEVADSFYVTPKQQLKKPLQKLVMPGFETSKEIKREGDVLILETELDKWRYLKGRKAEERISSKGTFYYKEGPMQLLDDIEKPSRTIITSEGGPGASRFKHLIDNGNGYRRLVPEELELLNMFPKGHTETGEVDGNLISMAATKRAFFMGNALVVGVVERVGKVLADRLSKFG